VASILVVDDNAANRSLLVILLARWGHRPIEATDGAQGLAKVRAEHPDLVLSDILMPTMDGYEFVHRIRADPAIAGTKVIFQTAHYHEREARKLASACGVSQILLRPSDPADIRKAIDRALALEPPQAPDDREFERDHVRVLTDKLSENVSELRATNVRLAALTDVNLQLASERNPRVLLQSVCRDARALMNARFAVLCVQPDSGSGANLCATSGIDGADELAIPRIDAGFFVQVMAGRGAHRWVDTARNAPTLGLPAGYPAANSALVAPIASADAVHGWICLLNKVGADGFDADDERILVSLASLVGRIYETTSMYADLRHYADQLKGEMTERKRATDQLLETELRFRQLAENIHEVFFLVGPAFMPMLYVSPAYEELWDRTCASLYANPLSWTEPIHAEDREAVMGAIGVEAAFEVKFRIERPSGGMRWISARGFPIRDRDGRIYRMAAVAKDITEQVGLERVLREKEAAMTRGDTLAKLAHIITRPDGSYQSWSDTLPQLVGLDPERVPSSARAWLALVHPDDRNLFRETSIAAGRKGTRAEVEYRLMRGDGVTINVRQVLDPIRDSANEKGRSRWFNTLQDVTDQKRAQEDLRESDRRYSDMLANVQLLSVMLDRDAKITYCNDYLLVLTGWRRDEVLGRDWFDIFQPPDKGETRHAFATLLDQKQDARHYESEILVRDGTRRLVRWNNVVLRSSAGEVIGTASMGEDITERQRAEDEVRRLNSKLEDLVGERTAELQAANRELESFSYSVSHDLRAPLQAIKGYASALQESTASQLDPTDRHYLDRIVSGGAAMDELIGDLLSLSQIARADFVATEVDITALATEALAALRAGEPTRRCEITVRPAMQAHGDPGLLRIVLTNLLGNAWKFSGGREVTFIEVGQLDDAGPMKTFFVRDRGAGFDPAYAQKLFGTFQRLHSHREFPGTGIGLATVLRVIARHGGSVRAEGAVNEGATFYFSLPEPPARAAAPEAAASAGPS
jgi:PAS domain S-box-containing protein